MSRNPYGAIRQGVHLEWGRKARKEETQQRGLNHTADREAIEEQLSEILLDNDDEV
jgi:hypothetical protein